MRIGQKLTRAEVAAEPDAVESTRRVDLAFATNTAKQVDGTVAPQLGAIVLILALFAPRLDTSALWWWAALGAFNVIRGAIFNHFHKRSIAAGRPHSWPGRINTMMALFFGVQWGALVIIADRSGSTEDASLAIVISLAAMSLSAIVSAGSRSMYLTSMVGNIATLLVGWLADSSLNWLFAVLVLLYFAVAASLQGTVHTMIRTNTESMHRNEFLAGRLTEVLAYEDPMTKLMNRDGLMAWLDERDAEWPDRSVAIALGNIERLSAVNELFGPEQGDRVLMEIGRRLAAPGDLRSTACRLAGDEFVLVEIIDGDPASAMLDVSERLRRSVQQPFDLDGQSVTVSMTIAVESGELDEAEQLLIGASAAVRSERARRSPSLAASTGPLGERRELIDDLRVGLRDGSLTPWFQPILDGELRSVVAWEALARWTHPTRGQIGPGDFLGLIELGQLSSEFSDRMIDDSLAFVVTLLEGGFGRCAAVHVNLTASQARRSDIVPTISASLDRHGVSASALTVEITEQDVLSVDEQLIANLRDLEDLGVGVSIDDFGTGYSSLSHLLDIRATELKIDKSFVDGLPLDPASAGLVRGVLGLARGMGLGVVAEGVETAAQAEFLRQEGCTSMQGYLVSPAIPSQEAIAFMAARSEFARPSGVSVNLPPPLRV